MKMKSKKLIDADVLTKARERLAIAFDRFDTISVSFSGGKDSTACLNLTLEVARELGRTPIDVIFQDEEAIPFETEHYVRRVAQHPDVNLRWFCVPFKHRNACSRLEPYWYPWAPEDEEKWVRPLPPEALTTIPGLPIHPIKDRLTVLQAAGLFYDPRQHGNVGMVMGIRAQESIMRTRSLLSRSNDENFLVPLEAETHKGNVTKVYPVYDWKTEDVWTAPAKFGWDHNRAYDQMEMVGISSHAQRCSPAYGEEPIRGLWIYAQAFPDVWDRMISRVPGAATAARYATTELYGYGNVRPIRPPDMPWQDFLLEYIGRFDPKERKRIASRILDEIDLHYRKTSDPIVEKSPHPGTGLCWEFLLALAMRGDFKGRRWAVDRSDPDNPKMWERYNQERKETVG